MKYFNNQINRTNRCIVRRCTHREAPILDEKTIHAVLIYTNQETKRTQIVLLPVDAGGNFASSAEE
jgi:hypothetical protein